MPKIPLPSSCCGTGVEESAGCTISIDSRVLEGGGGAKELGAAGAPDAGGGGGGADFLALVFDSVVASEKRDEVSELS